MNQPVRIQLDLYHIVGYKNVAQGSRLP